MHPKAFRSVLAPALALCAASSLAAQAPAPAHLRVQRTEILDRHGFEKPMVAFTMFIPAGWKGDGDIEYVLNNPCLMERRLKYQATSPDGIGAITIAPEEKWGFSNMPVQDNCPHPQITTARGYLESWVQRYRPGARVLDYRARPDLSTPYKYVERNENGMRAWSEGGEILAGYQVNGKAVREAISVLIFFVRSEFPGINGNIVSFAGFTGPAFGMRMPEGTLNFKMVEALRQSVLPAPQWKALQDRAAAQRQAENAATARKIGEINHQIAMDNIRGAADRSAIIAQTADDINKIQMGTWQNTSESMDRTQRERIESIRGVETYNDPHYGGTVQLSNQYQHAWQLRDGSYVLTDDVNFDPNRALGVEGTRLKPTQ